MDAFSRLIDLIRSEGKVYNPPSILFAKVVSVVPFIISVGDLQLDKDNLLVVDYVADYIANYNVSHQINVGDLVAIMPTYDRQIFVVLAKVVSI